MEQLLSSGLTFQEVQAKINATGVYGLTLHHVNRRAKKKLRNNGETEDRQLWRLILQRDNGNAVTTIFRKNLHYSEADLLEQKADDKLIEKINNALINC